MVSWREALGRALVTGTSASVFSSLALGACGHIERGTAAGPLNGPSQWLWGEDAARRRRATLRHTLVGFVIHHFMSIGWATLHEKHFARPARAVSPSHRLLTSATTAALACFVDYRVAPTRLRPGFEKQLGRRSLFVVYAAFALGLAAGESVRAGHLPRSLRGLRPPRRVAGRLPRML